ncbi:hypothetical protein NHQ30_009291 [Ciborinia camelliae]|nr:hypothetical protein NHQ30_009291 [Ciborinia camelliae]
MFLQRRSGPLSLPGNPRTEHAAEMQPVYGGRTVTVQACRGERSHGRGAKEEEHDDEREGQD